MYACQKTKKKHIHIKIACDRLKPFLTGCPTSSFSCFLATYWKGAKFLFNKIPLSRGSEVFTSDFLIYLLDLSEHDKLSTLIVKTKYMNKMVGMSNII